MIELAAIMIVRLKWLHGKTQKVCVQRNFDRTRHVSYSQCETWNKSEWENPYLAISVCPLLNHEVVGCLVLYKIVLGYENSLKVEVWFIGEILNIPILSYHVALEKSDWSDPNVNALEIQNMWWIWKYQNELCNHNLNHLFSIKIFFHAVEMGAHHSG